MDEKLVVLLNRQLSAELETSNLYAAMCADCLSMTELGAAKFFAQKSREELDHRRLVFSYLYARGATISIGAAAAQSYRLLACKNLSDLTDAFYTAEKRTTELLRECWECAEATGDVRSSVFLEGMLQEQIEEELEAREISRQAAKYTPGEPFHFDRYLDSKSSAPTSTDLSTALGVKMVL